MLYVIFVNTDSVNFKYLLLSCRIAKNCCLVTWSTTGQILVLVYCKLVYSPSISRNNALSFSPKKEHSFFLFRWGDWGQGNLKVVASVPLSHRCDIQSNIFHATIGSAQYCRREIDSTFAILRATNSGVDTMQFIHCMQCRPNSSRLSVL